MKSCGGEMQLGDFTYVLRLTAQEAKAVEVAPLSVPVGAKDRRLVTIQNPLNQEVVLEGSSSSPPAFSVPFNVILPSGGAVSVPIEYSPCSIGARFPLTSSTRLLQGTLAASCALYHTLYQNLYRGTLTSLGRLLHLDQSVVRLPHEGILISSQQDGRCFSVLLVLVLQVCIRRHVKARR